MKKFQSCDFLCLKELVGKSFNDIFYQPVADILAYVDMFVVNFGEEKIEASFHVFSLFRVTYNGNILLTCNDSLFDSALERLTTEKEDNARSHLYKGTLLHSNIKRVKNILKGAKVSNAYSNDIGDVIIEFDNSVKMEIIIDALCNQECYRLITYTESASTHYVVECKKKEIIYSIDAE